MVYCPNCCAKVEKGDNYCRNCAHPFRDAIVPIGDAISSDRMGGDAISGDSVGGDKVGKDRITAGDMTDVSNAAIGEGSSVTSESIEQKIVEAVRPAGREISLLWGLFKYATFVTAAGSVILAVIFSNGTRKPLEQVNGSRDQAIVRVTASPESLAVVAQVSTATATWPASGADKADLTDDQDVALATNPAGHDTNGDSLYDGDALAMEARPTSQATVQWNSVQLNSSSHGVMGTAPTPYEVDGVAPEVTSIRPAAIDLPRAIAQFDINVRSGPGVNYNRIGGLPVGAEGLITGRNQEGTWWQINFNGQAGWVFGELVFLSNVDGIEVPQNFPPTPNRTDTPFAP